MVEGPARLGKVGFRAVERLEEGMNVLLVGFLGAWNAVSKTRPSEVERVEGMERIERFTYVAKPDL